MGQPWMMQPSNSTGARKGGWRIVPETRNRLLSIQSEMPAKSKMDDEVGNASISKETGGVVDENWSCRPETSGLRACWG